MGKMTKSDMLLFIAGAIPTDLAVPKAKPPGADPALFKAMAARMNEALSAMGTIVLNGCRKSILIAPKKCDRMDSNV